MGAASKAVIIVTARVALLTLAACAQPGECAADFQVAKDDLVSTGRNPSEISSTMLPALG